MTFMKTELLKEKLIIRPEEGGQLLEIKVEIKSCVHAFRFTTRGNSFVYAFAAHSSTGWQYPRSVPRYIVIPFRDFDAREIFRLR